MDKNQRNSRRQKLGYTAWILLGPGQLHGCVLSNVSETGARIDVEDSKIVPDRFALWLTSNGAAQRACRVVWRKPQNIGVAFERQKAKTSHATLVPNLDDIARPLRVKSRERT